MLRFISAAAVAAAIAVAGTSAAIASPHAAQAAHGPERIQIMSTSTTSASSSVIASGVFTAAGHAKVGNTPVTKLVFPRGIVKISHKPARSGHHFSPRTCLNVITQSGTYKLLSGTGAYAGVSGHGTFRLGLMFIAARVHGQCSSAKPPVAEQEVLQLTGTAHL
jgi:hypothetical protein